MRHEHGDKVNARTRALLEARLHDPFSVLGLHRRADAFSVRLYEPHAEAAWLHDSARWAEMREEQSGLGSWREIFNSDSRYFGGSDCGNSGLIEARSLAWMGRTYSAPMTLPALAAIILQADTTQDAPR